MATGNYVSHAAGAVRYRPTVTERQRAEELNAIGLALAARAMASPVLDRS